MTDEPITPEEQARNRRPFGSVIGWLMSGEHRRPGMLGAAVSLQGRAGPSKAQLTRSRDGWELATPDASENLATVDVVALIGTGKFFPRTVDVVPELAELLFQEAVHQAEQSLLQLSAARSSVEEHLERDPANILGPFVMASASLDRSVRASIGSIVLAIASAEAQANRWADILGGWQGGEDRLSVASKGSGASRSMRSLDQSWNNALRGTGKCNQEEELSMFTRCLSQKLSPRNRKKCGSTQSVDLHRCEKNVFGRPFQLYRFST